MKGSEIFLTMLPHVTVYFQRVVVDVNKKSEKFSIKNRRRAGQAAVRWEGKAAVLCVPASEGSDVVKA
jgi:hypothetical protein